MLQKGKVAYIFKVKTYLTLKKRSVNELRSRLTGEGQLNRRSPCTSWYVEGTSLLTRESLASSPERESLTTHGSRASLGLGLEGPGTHVTGMVQKHSNSCSNCASILALGTWKVEQLRG